MSSDDLRAVLLCSIVSEPVARLNAIYQVNTVDINFIDRVDGAPDGCDGH